ncbi:sigma-70 family RNA polymerase sigma factor [bacterium]|nr:sigma-70 family RNA polymerase sigma factor [bacterium]
MEVMDNEHLVRLAAAGDAKAFARLIEENYMLIYKVAYKWCGRRDDAQDIAQEVCMALAAKLSGYRGEAKFTSWLYRVTINAAKDYCRARERVNNREIAFSEGFDAASDEVNAEQRLLAAESYRHIHGLPEGIRDAVLLVFGENMNHKQAAAILGCAETTISWRIFQARKLLKPLMTARPESPRTGNSHAG